jgi:hypothetical protein
LWIYLDDDLKDSDDEGDTTHDDSGFTNTSYMSALRKRLKNKRLNKRSRVNGDHDDDDEDDDDDEEEATEDEQDLEDDDKVGYLDEWLKTSMSIVTHLFFIHSLWYDDRKEQQKDSALISGKGRGLFINM